MTIPLRPDEPLGPLNFQYISDAGAAALLDLHGPFLEGLMTEPRLLIGRKGSGKSTILYAISHFDALRNRIEREKPNVRFGATVSKKRFVKTVSTFEQFDKIALKVDDALTRSRENKNGLPVSAEAVADLWKDELWYEIVVFFYSKYIESPHLFALREVENVIAVCDSNARHALFKQQNKGLVTTVEHTRIEIFNLKQDAKRDILTYLNKHNMRFYLLIDSIEEYPIYNEAWQRVVRGFLPALESIQQDSSPHVHIMATIPEEVEQIFLGLTGTEPGKNFSSAVKVQWKANDLKRLVAHRFKMMIEDIISPQSQLRSFAEDYDLYNFEKLSVKFSKLDLEKNDHVNKFFSAFLPNEIVNSLGIPESTWGYVLRHSHYNPRPLLIGISKIILASGENWRRKARISSEEVVDGIRNSDIRNAQQVIVPFKSLFPNIEEIVESFCKGVPPIFDFKQLRTMCQAVSSRFEDHPSGKIFGHTDVMNVLYQIGIIGQIVEPQEVKDDAENTGKERFESRIALAKFNFSSERIPSFDNHHMFCLHPIFSGTTGARERDGNKFPSMSGKIVYPVE